MFVEYSLSDDILHRLDVRTKTFGFVVITVTSFAFLSPLFVLPPLIVSAVLFHYARVPFSGLIPVVKPLLPIFILMVILAGFTFPSQGDHISRNADAIFRLSSGDSFVFTAGGLLYGTTLVMRIFVMVVVSTVLTYTTPVGDILQMMKKLKMPYQLAFVIATGIRFIPVMRRKAELIQQAQMSRGASFGGGGPVRSLKSYIPILVPMIVESIRMSDNLAAAMLNRGFGAMEATTALREIRMKPVDYAVSAGELIVLAMVIVAKIKNFGAL